MATQIKYLNLCNRSMKIFNDLNMFTVADITQHTEKEIMALPNFGHKCMRELKDELSKIGKQFTGEKLQRTLRQRIYYRSVNAQHSDRIFFNDIIDAFTVLDNRIRELEKELGHD